MEAVVGEGGLQSPRRAAEPDARGVPRTAWRRAASEDAKAAAPGEATVRAGDTPHKRRSAEACARGVPRTAKGRAHAASRGRPKARAWSR